METPADRHRRYSPLTGEWVLVSTQRTVRRGRATSTSRRLRLFLSTTPNNSTSSTGARACPMLPPSAGLGSAESPRGRVQLAVGRIGGGGCLLSRRGGAL